MKHPTKFYMLMALVIGGIASANAGESYGLNVPVGGSIAMPGASTATFTNPAGLIGNRGARLSLQAGSDKPMDDPNYRALALVGNGIIGASAGVDYKMRDGGTNTGDAVYGLALAVTPLRFALGASGRTGMKNAKGTDFNAGFLFMPLSALSIGGTAFGLKGKIDSFGGGIGLGLLPGIDLVGDAVVDSKFKHPEFKPGLKIANNSVGVSVSYGTGVTDQFSKDISAAAYLKIGMNSEIEFEYNHGGEIPKYYGSLSLGF